MINWPTPATIPSTTTTRPAGVSIIRSTPPLTQSTPALTRSETMTIVTSTTAGKSRPTVTIRLPADTKTERGGEGREVEPTRLVIRPQQHGEGGGEVIRPQQGEGGVKVIRPEQQGGGGEEEDEVVVLQTTVPPSAPTVTITTAAAAKSADKSAGRAVVAEKKKRERKGKKVAPAHKQQSPVSDLGNIATAVPLVTTVTQAGSGVEPSAPPQVSVVGGFADSDVTITAASNVRPYPSTSSIPYPPAAAAPYPPTAGMPYPPTTAAAGTPYPPTTAAGMPFPANMPYGGQTSFSGPYGMDRPGYYPPPYGFWPNMMPPPAATPDQPLPPHYPGYPGAWYPPPHMMHPHMMSPYYMPPAPAADAFPPRRDGLSITNISDTESAELDAASRELEEIINSSHFDV